MRVPVLETDDGPVRVPENAINNLLTRLHNAWKKGDMRWLSGRMHGVNNSHCMLGGLEHMSEIIGREEGLTPQERMKLYHDGIAAVAATLGATRGSTRQHMKNRIAETNDGPWRRSGRGMEKALEAIRSAIQRENA